MTVVVLSAMPADLLANTAPLAEVTIIDSPFKLAIPSVESTQNVSVIAQDDILRRSHTSVEDALTQVSSIQSGMGGRLGYDEYSIRGFSQSYYQFKNGLRLDPGYLQQEELFGLERIEILKGPSSVEYGQIAPGGVLNMVSKQPVASPIRQIGVSVGSWGARRWTADIGDRLADNPHWQFRVPMVWSEKNDFQNFVFSQRQFVAPTFSYRPSDQTQLTIYTLYQQDDFRRSVSIPWAIASEVDRSTYLGSPFLPTFSRPQTQLGYDLDHRWSQGWQMRQQLRRTQYDLFGSSFFPVYNSQQPDWVSPGGGTFERQIHILTFNQQFEYTHPIGSYEHRWLIGFDQTDYQAKKRGGRANTPQLNFIAPEYPPLTTPTLLDQGREYIGQQGFYSQYRVQHRQRWAFNLGMRHSRVANDKWNGQQRSTQSARLAQNTFSTGLIGLDVGGFYPYANYSQSFEPITSWEPIFDGRPRPTISEGIQKEVGVKWQSRNQRHTAVLSRFDISRSNVYNAVTLNQNYFSAASDQLNRGFEFETRSSWKNGIDLQTGYTLIDAAVASTQLAWASGEVGTRPFGTARHTAYMGANFNGTMMNLPDSEWMLAYRYVGERPINLDGDVLAGYTTLDLGVQYQMNDQTQAFLTIKNVTNEAYWVGPYFGNVNFGAPQTWLAGVRVDIR